MIRRSIFMGGQLTRWQLLPSCLLPVPSTLFGRGVCVGVRHVCPQFSQANDQGLELMRRKGRKQSSLARKRCDDDAVVQRVPRFRQANNPRAIVLGIEVAGDKPSVLQLVKGSAHCALVETNSIDDLIGADFGHACEHSHHAPFRDADSEMLPVRVGSASRESVRNVSEKIGNVTIEVEHGADGCRRVSFTSRSLVHQRVSATLGDLILRYASTSSVGLDQ